MSTDVSLRIVALNIMGGGAPRAASIADALSALDPHVVVLSEAYPTGRTQKVLEALSRTGLSNQATANSLADSSPRAVAIAARLPLDYVRQPLDGSPNGQRVLEAMVGDVLVCGVYFPLGKPKVAFWRNEFLPYAEQSCSANAVMIGDWNSGAHFVDEAGATLDGAAEFARMSTLGWQEAWRTTYPEGREYTWYSKPHDNGFRLDHAFLSPSLAPRLAAARYDHTTRAAGASDHSALVVELR